MTARSWCRVRVAAVNGIDAVQHIVWQWAASRRRHKLPQLQLARGAHNHAGHQRSRQHKPGQAPDFSCCTARPSKTRACYSLLNISRLGTPPASPALRPPCATAQKTPMQDMTGQSRQTGATHSITYSDRNLGRVGPSPQRQLHRRHARGGGQSHICGRGLHHIGPRAVARLCLRVAAAVPVQPCAWRAAVRRQVLALPRASGCGGPC